MITLKIGRILLFIKESKKRNLCGISIIYIYCHNIKFKDYYWNLSNPNKQLNNIQEKSTTATIELDEEIKCDTFHL